MTPSLGFLLVAALLVAPVTPEVHELNEAAATLVVREGGHVELRLLVPWADVLRQRLMPGQPMADFLARVTSERSPDVARAIAAIESEIARATSLRRSGGPPVRFTGWRWPTDTAIEAALREELMARLSGGESSHPSRLQVTAEAVVPARSSVRVTFGPALGPVLLTVVHPEEAWVPAGATSAPICVATAQRAGCR